MSPGRTTRSSARGYGDNRIVANAAGGRLNKASSITPRGRRYPHQKAKKRNPRPPGDPVAIEDFATGWLLDDGVSQFGRVAGLAAAPDGSLLVTDDQNGVMGRGSSWPASRPRR